MSFLKEYWLWIVIPFVVVLAAAALFIWFTDGDNVSAFQYNVF